MKRVVNIIIESTSSVQFDRVIVSTINAGKCNLNVHEETISLSLINGYESCREFDTLPNLSISYRVSFPLKCLNDKNYVLVN